MSDPNPLHPRHPDTSTGFALFGCLGFVLVILKLGGLPAWPWWLVTLPMWGPATLVLTTYAVVSVGAAVTRVARAAAGR